MGTEQRSSPHGVLSDAMRPDSFPLPAGDMRAEAHLRAGSVAGLRSLRTGLAHCLEQGGCEVDTIADAQLVLAEIATNAFVHDTAPLVDVQVTCWDGEIRICTWHRGEDTPPPYPVQPVTAVGSVVSSAGRGLAIVDRIALSREVGNDDGCTTTIVRMRC